MSKKINMALLLMSSALYSTTSMAWSLQCWCYSGTVSVMAHVGPCTGDVDGCYSRLVENSQLSTYTITEADAERFTQDLNTHFTEYKNSETASLNQAKSLDK